MSSISLSPNEIQNEMEKPLDAATESDDYECIEATSMHFQPTSSRDLINDIVVDRSYCARWVGANSFNPELKGRAA